MTANSGPGQPFLAGGPDDHVVGAGLRVQAVGTGLAERGTDAIDKHDFTQSAGHGEEPSLGRTVR